MEKEGPVIRGSEAGAPEGPSGAEELLSLALAFSRLLREKSGTAGGAPSRAVIGFDAFRSSWDLQNSLVRGLSAGGTEVIHLGLVPAPLVLFSARRLGAGGAVILAGDCGPGRKSLRLYAGGSPLGPDDLSYLRREMEKGSAAPLLPVRGRVRYLNMIPDYLQELERRFDPVRPLLRRFRMDVVVGANHGPASVTAPQALLRLGCRVVKLGCTIEAGKSASPRRHDAPDILQELGLVVRASRADFGVSIDAEGRRIALVDGGGEPVIGSTIEALLATEDTRANGSEDGTVDLLRLVDILARTRADRGRKILFRSILPGPIPRKEASLGEDRRPGRRRNAPTVKR